jgi:hypothetical protein
MNHVKKYIENHQEISSGSTLIIYGVNSNDMLTVLNEDPKVDDWDVVYYCKVTKAIKTIDKLFML